MADLQDPQYWQTLILRSAGRLLMLAALAEQPRHGYAIAQRISTICGDWCSPSDAMIYPGIRDLERAGLIACDVATHDGRQRRVCRLTPSGEEALRVGTEAWARYLPSLGRVVSAIQRGAPSTDTAIDLDGCPTCCGSTGSTIPDSAINTRPGKD